MNSTPIFFKIDPWIIRFDGIFFTGMKNKQTEAQFDRVVTAPNFCSATSGYKKPRGKLRLIVKAIICDLWPLPEGIPAWMKTPAIVEEVNKRLKDGKLWPKPACYGTVRRAVNDLDAETKGASVSAET